MRLVLGAGACLAVVLVALVLLVAGRPGGVTIERGVVTQSAGDAVVATTSALLSEPMTKEAPTAPSPAETTVHVDGAVVSPGVYALEGASPRVNDAVLAAGGLLPDADTSPLNLAATISDGDKVHVPTREEVASGVVASPAAVGSLDALAPGTKGGGGAAGEGIVNINAATAAELDELPGVGPSTAAAIVEDREANGPFSSVEDLMRVSGIGEKKFAKLKDRIRV